MNSRRPAYACPTCFAVLYFPENVRGAQERLNHAGVTGWMRHGVVKCPNCQIQEKTTITFTRLRY